MLHAPLATRILGLDVWVRAYACVVRGRGRLAKKIDSGVFNPRIFPKKGVPAEPDIQNLLEVGPELCLVDFIVICLTCDHPGRIFIFFPATAKQKIPLPSNTATPLKKIDPGMT
jgi:hypothetical protein